MRLGRTTAPAFVVVLLVAHPALAVDEVESADSLERVPATNTYDRDTDPHYASPQWFALEFRFSSYSPNVDDDPALGGKTPYRDTFGTMPRLLFGVELDVQPLKLKKWAEDNNIPKPFALNGPHGPGGHGPMHHR